MHVRWNDPESAVRADERNGRRGEGQERTRRTSLIQARVPRMNVPAQVVQLFNWLPSCSRDPDKKIGSAFHRPFRQFLFRWLPPKAPLRDPAARGKLSLFLFLSIYLSSYLSVSPIFYLSRSLASVFFFSTLAEITGAINKWFTFELSALDVGVLARRRRAEKLKLTAERTVFELINQGGDMIDKMRKFLDNGTHDPFPY